MAARSLITTLLNQAIDVVINKAVPALAELAWHKGVRMFTRSDQGHVVDAIASRTISAVIEVYYTSAPSATVSAALEEFIEACNNNSSMRSSLLSFVVVSRCTCMMRVSRSHYEGSSPLHVIRAGNANLTLETSRRTRTVCEHARSSAECPT